MIILVCEWLADQATVPATLIQARLMAGFGLNVSLELVTAVWFEGQWHFLLCQRPKEDPDFPGEPWHSAGKIWTKGATVSSLQQKLASTDETGLPIGELKFAGTVSVLNHQRGRGKNLGGHWLCQVFVQVLPSIPPDGSYVGRFWPAGQLPTPMVGEHALGILPCAKQFLETGIATFREIRLS